MNDFRFQEELSRSMLRPNPCQLFLLSPRVAFCESMSVWRLVASNFTCCMRKHMELGGSTWLFCSHPAPPELTPTPLKTGKFRKNWGKLSENPHRNSFLSGFFYCSQALFPSSLSGKAMCFDVARLRIPHAPQSNPWFSSSILTGKFSRE